MCQTVLAGGVEVATATEVLVPGGLDVVASQPGRSKPAAFIPLFTDCDPHRAAQPACVSAVTPVLCTGTYSVYSSQLFSQVCTVLWVGSA